MSKKAISKPKTAAPAVVQSLTPMQMLQVAVEKNADIDKIEKLMDMSERWEKNEARKAYMLAMANFKADPPILFKNKHVSYKNKDGSYTEYNHPTLDHIASAISEAMSPHGLSFRWDTSQLDGGMIRVTCIITHVLGHSESVWLQSGADQTGGKNNVQAIGSTVKYLQRYTLEAATGLAAADEDDDGRGSEPPPEKITDEQALTIHAMITENDLNMPRFLGMLKSELGATSIEDLNASVYDHVIDRIKITISNRLAKEGAANV